MVVKQDSFQTEVKSNNVNVTIFVRRNKFLITYVRSSIFDCHQAVGFWQLNIHLLNHVVSVVKPRYGISFLQNLATNK